MKKIHVVISRLINPIITILFVFLYIQSPCIAASLTEIGMITKIQGEITYWNKTVKEKVKPAQCFMKVRTDDEFKLASNSELQLIFFSNARIEIWKGPAELKLSESMGQLTGENKKNDKLQIIRHPAAMVNKVREISPSIDPTKLNRSASTIIGNNNAEKIPLEKISLRSASLNIEEKEEINSAKQVCNTLLASSSSNDITPELYLFSILADYEQFEDIKQLILKLKAKHPDNSAVKQLEEWLRDQAIKKAEIKE